MTKKLIRVSTDLKVSIHDYPVGDWENQHNVLTGLIGNDCRLYQIVRPNRLYKVFPVQRYADENMNGLVMLIDEEGLLKDDMEVNMFASWLYETDKHGYPIVGNVLFAAEEMTDEGPDLAGLYVTIANMIATYMKNVIGTKERPVQRRHV